MASGPSDKNEPPAPEELKPQSDDESPDETGEEKSSGHAMHVAAPAVKRPRRGTYRPSHKATFIGLAVIIAILAVNAGIIIFVIKGQAKTNAKLAAQGEVTVNQAALDKLGVNRNPVGDQGIQLTVNPNAKFNGNVQIGGDVTIGGQFFLNKPLSANSATFTTLKAGKTAVSDLNINGDATASNLNVRKDMTLVGTARLQGPVTMSSLLTAAGINVTGNLAVGGVLSVNSFHASMLTVDGNMTVGGHIITRGSAPGVSRGGAVGSSGTVSISGNDAAGTVAVNAGVGASSGTVACVSFRHNYSNTPHVVITPSAPLNAYTSRNAAGFCIGVGTAMSPGGYYFDYIIHQ
ncbi:MAG TPA: hypothetical protein VFL85_03685 [Candidatus Saccharimonadales bacterium]|nr:hypothetical protein [Candidatus Saccharimonadales bacterium]